MQPSSQEARTRLLYSNRFCSSRHLFLPVLAPFLVLALWAGGSRASCSSQNACIPPPTDCGYTSTCTVLYAPGVEYGDLFLHDFTSCVMVVPGMVQSGFVSCQVDLDLSLDAGSTWTQYSGIPATGWMTFTGNGQGGQGEDLYIASLDQLNFSGGGLPVGIAFRESPILTSTGQASVMLQGNSYQIDSFFDAYLEFSFDGGQTWYPPLSTCHIVFRPFIAPVKMSTWGQIKTLYR